jgi:hypothetical protein
LYSNYPSTKSICGSAAKKDWRIVAGDNFGVDKSGNLYCSNANIIGNGTFGGTIFAEKGYFKGTIAAASVSFANTEEVSNLKDY